MRRYSVAVVVDSSSTFAQGVLRGITQYVFENGPWNIAYEERSLDSVEPTWLKRWKGDGIIIRTRTAQTSRLAIKRNVKVVDLGEEPLPNTPIIAIDHKQCADKAAEFLAQRQFGSFAYVGIKDRPFSQFRHDEFIRQMGANTPSFEIPLTCLRISPTTAKSSLEPWLKSLPKPCGLMACNDLAANFVIQSCVRANIMVPDEIAVIGVDNDEIYCNMSPVPLTSIELDTQRMGWEAAALLHKLMLGQKPPEIPFAITPLKIVERGSTDFLAIDDLTVKKALVIIRDSACDGITVKQLTEKMEISRRHLERRFAAVLKTSVCNQIMRYQMARALDLIKGTTLTLTAIAKRAGFKNTAHFCTAFKKFYHKTPTQLRDE